MRRIIPTGCGLLDEQLRGGLLEGSLMLVYGEPKIGKTTLAIQCAVNCARMGYKTIFIDCDARFFAQRMKQIASADFNTLASQIILLKPESFEEQTAIVEKLDRYISKNVGLVVVDTITGLYREKLGDDLKKTVNLNRELNRQMAYLAQIVKTRKVAGLIVSQVRSVVFDAGQLVQPVAARVLMFWADIVINLKPTAQTSVVEALVKTHMGKQPTKSVFLKIEEKGLVNKRG